MPNITSAGTYTKNTPGFEFLEAKDGVRALLFAGSTVGTTCEIKYTDDANTSRTLENGTISTLPASKAIDVVNRDLEIVVTGSPNFNVSGG